MKIALFGAPNCGKSTLFNRLTRGHAQTGNRAGVTVEIARGKLRPASREITLLDLPGVYGPTPRTDDERAAWEALTREQPDCLLFVADAGQLSRQLPLLDTLSPRFPTILAVTMYDELQREGKHLDTQALADLLGIPIFPVDALRGDGVAALQQALEDPPNRVPHPHRSHCGQSCADCRATRDVRLRQLLPRQSARSTRQTRADCLLLSPVMGTLALLLFFGALLFFAFGPIGDFLSDGLSTLILTPVRLLLERLESTLPAFWFELLTKGVLGGLSAILDFLPRLFLLFFLLSIAEDSGYLARVGALAHRTLCFFGLNGGAAIPLLLGVGCSVPAVLAARHIEDAPTRRRVAGLVPLIPCSARLPVLAAVGGLFFVAPLLPLAIAAGAGLLLLLLFASLTRGLEKPAPLIAELPRFRFPSMQKVTASAGRRTLHFLTRAGAVLLPVTVLLALITRLSPALYPVSDPSHSLLAALAGSIAPLFAPLGFDNWQCAAALLCGIGAKEATLAALGVFCGGELLTLTALLSPAAALSFLTFFACYCPCAATLLALWRETGAKRTLLTVAASFGGAYLLSFFFYRVALLLGA